MTLTSALLRQKPEVSRAARLTPPAIRRQRHSNCSVTVDGKTAGRGARNGGYKLPKGPHLLCQHGKERTETRGAEPR